MTAVQVINHLEHHAIHYGLQLMELMAQAMLPLLHVLAPLYVVYLVMNGVTRGELPWLKLFHMMVVWTVVGQFLIHPVLIKAWLVDPTLDAMWSLEQLVSRTLSDGGLGRHPLLARFSDWVVRYVNFAQLDSPWSLVTNAGLFFGSTLLALVHNLALAIYVFRLADVVLTVMLITACSPLLLLLAGFDSSRGCFWAAARSLLQTALSLFFSSATLTWMLYAMAHEPVPDPANASHYMKTDLWGSFLIGIIGILAQFQLATLASNLSGVMAPPSSGAMIGSVAMGAATTWLQTGGVARAAAGIQRGAGQAWRMGVGAWQAAAGSDYVQQLKQTYDRSSLGRKSS